MLGAKVISDHEYLRVRGGDHDGSCADTAGHTGNVFGVRADRRVADTAINLWKNRAGDSSPPSSTYKIPTSPHVLRNLFTRARVIMRRRN